MKSRLFGPTLVMDHIEPMNGIQLGLSLCTGQIKNSFRDALTKEEHNQILDVYKRQGVEMGRSAGWYGNSKMSFTSG